MWLWGGEEIPLENRNKLINERAIHIVGELIKQIQTDPLHDNIQFFRNEYIGVSSELSAEQLAHDKAEILRAIHQTLLNEYTREDKRIDRINFLKKWFDDLTITLK